MNKIKIFIVSLFFFYPAFELSRIILAFPYWTGREVIPVFEISFIWVMFMIGLWISDKNIKYMKKG